jgi:hypothetical protein
VKSLPLAVCCFLVFIGLHRISERAKSTSAHMKGRERRNRERYHLKP